MQNINRTRPKKIEVLDWGLIDYREAFRKQDELVQKIISGDENEKIIFCSHPPIVTLGRGTRPGDVFAWTGDTCEVNRGGRATYHGPSQLIMYPLLDLGGATPCFVEKKIKAKDLHQYMRILELSVLKTLQHFGIEAQVQSVQRQVGEQEADPATGVWVGDQKVAALGIAVRKWVTSHGVALNLFEDDMAFQGFYPCGFQSSQVTSIQALTGLRVDPADVRQIWLKHFLDLIAY